MSDVKHSISDTGLVKILFHLGQNTWHGYATETLWAEPLHGDRYKLGNTPFYFKGVSFEDIVVATKQTSSELLIFRRVHARGGHSTYRLILEPKITDQQFRYYWDSIEKFHCSYEEGTQRLYAVDVPAKAAIEKVYALLEKGEADGIWEFEEGHCGHVVDNG